MGKTMDSMLSYDVNTGEQRAPSDSVLTHVYQAGKRPEPSNSVANPETNQENDGEPFPPHDTDDGAGSVDNGNADINKPGPSGEVKY